MLINLKRFGAIFACLLGCAVLGCGSSNTPQGPEEGSVQAYLDQNPDVAARLTEGDGDGGDAEEVETDNDTYDDE